MSTKSITFPYTSYKPQIEFDEEIICGERKFTFIEEIAYGGNSVICKIESTDEKDTNYYAMKINIQGGNFKEEKKFLKSLTLQQDNITFFTQYICEGQLAVKYITQEGSRKIIEDKKLSYYVMEYVENNLEELLCDDKVSSFETLYPYFLQLTEGLIKIHENGILHRDLKPSNILAQGKLLKISDFGFAIKKDQCRSIDGPTLWPTPEYLKICNKQQEYCPIFATDIFQLGCIFYFILTKKYPIGSTNFEHLPDSELISPILKKTLEINPMLRYQSATDLKNDLMRLKKDEKIISYII